MNQRFIYDVRIYQKRDENTDSLIRPIGIFSSRRKAIETIEKMFRSVSKPLPDPVIKYGYYDYYINEKFFISIITDRLNPEFSIYDMKEIMEEL